MDPGSARGVYATGSSFFGSSGASCDVLVSSSSTVDGFRTISEDVGDEGEPKAGRGVRFLGGDLMSGVRAGEDEGLAFFDFSANKASARAIRAAKASSSAFFCVSASFLKEKRMFISKIKQKMHVVVSEREQTCLQQSCRVFPDSRLAGRCR